MKDEMLFNCECAEEHVMLLNVAADHGHSRWVDFASVDHDLSLNIQRTGSRKTECIEKSRFARTTFLPFFLLLQVNIIVSIRHKTSHKFLIVFM